MAISSTCPQCGTPAQTGATVCTACGHRLDEPAADGADADTEPVSALTGVPHEPWAGTEAPPVGSAPMKFLDDMRERWGVAQTPTFIAAVLMAALAFVLSTGAVISYLTAGNDELLQKIDAEIWLQLAFGAALGSTALLVLERWRSPEPATYEPVNRDLQVGLLACGLVLLFVLAGLFKGQDESQDAVSAWFGYARVWAVLIIGWFAISRPIPLSIGNFPTIVIGMGAVAIGMIMLLIGTLQGRSDDFSTLVSGLSLLAAGTTVMLLAFAWFLGLQPRTNVM